MWGFPWGSAVKNLPAIPGLGRSPGEGHGKLLHYTCLENPRDRGAWWAIESIASQRVGHYRSDWVCTHSSLCLKTIWPELPFQNVNQSTSVSFLVFQWLPTALEIKFHSHTRILWINIACISHLISGSSSLPLMTLVTVAVLHFLD